MNEHVLRFGDNGNLIGIYTPAATAGKRPGIVLVNSGVIHRSGPNRLYVSIARQLAAAGYPVLRFDLSAIGDSSPRNDALSFEKSAISETSAAMAALGARSGATGFILCGICSGADISFLTTRDNPAAIGAVLINGRGLHGVTDDSGDDLEAAADAALGADASTRYLLKSALFNPHSWRKLLSGRVNYLELMRLVGGKLLRPVAPREALPDTAPALHAAFDQVLGRGTAVLMVYSEGDLALDYMKLMFGKDMKKYAAHTNFSEVRLAGADHTFTPRDSRDALIAALRSWADARFAH
jgi:pimeloyl-ACP methyl ester carboxylesterase